MSELTEWIASEVEENDENKIYYTKLYFKSEVDKVLAEKEAQILDLIEQVQKERAAKVDYKISANDLNNGLKKACEEIRSLKCALWLARAERANDKARIFYFAETCGVKLNIDGYSNREKGHTRMCTSRWWRLTWLKVERKCRAKMEEYK